MMAPDEGHENVRSQVIFLPHAYTCDWLRCTPTCDLLKRLIGHYNLCKKKAAFIHNCEDCTRLKGLSTYHAKFMCRESEDCPVILCKTIKSIKNWKQFVLKGMVQMQPFSVQFNSETEGIRRVVEFKIPTVFEIKDQDQSGTTNPPGAINQGQPIVINLGNAAANLGEQVLVNGKRVATKIRDIAVPDANTGDLEPQVINQQVTNDQRQPTAIDPVPAGNNQHPTTTTKAQPAPNVGNPGSLESNPNSGTSKQFRPIAASASKPVVGDLKPVAKVVSPGNSKPGPSKKDQSTETNPKVAASLGQLKNQTSITMPFTSKQHQHLSFSPKPAANNQHDPDANANQMTLIHLKLSDNRVIKVRPATVAQREFVLRVLAENVVNLENRVINSTPAANNQLQPVAASQQLQPVATNVQPAADNQYQPIPAVNNQRQSVTGSVNPGNNWFSNLINQLPFMPFNPANWLINPMPYDVNHQFAVPQYPSNAMCPYQPEVAPNVTEVTDDWRDKVTEKMRKRQCYKLWRAFRSSHPYPPRMTFNNFCQKTEEVAFEQATSLHDYYRRTDKMVKSFPWGCPDARRLY